MKILRILHASALAMRAVAGITAAAIVATAATFAATTDLPASDCALACAMLGAALAAVALATLSPSIYADNERDVEDLVARLLSWLTQNEIAIINAARLAALAAAAPALGLAASFAINFFVFA